MSKIQSNVPRKFPNEFFFRKTTVQSGQHGSNHPFADFHEAKIRRTYVFSAWRWVASITDGGSKVKVPGWKVSEINLRESLKKFLLNGFPLTRFRPRVQTAIGIRHVEPRININLPAFFESTLLANREFNRGQS